MNSGDSGSFTRLRYDRCSHQKDIYQSAEPLQYVMYSGKFENCSRCVYDENSFYRPFDDAIVDTESELKGINRIASSCPQFKYSPHCKKSKTCTSTFDKSAPVILVQEMCPIVSNNIPRIDSPKFELNTEHCKTRVARTPHSR
jgi:hypothetical protein